MREQQVRTGALRGFEGRLLPVLVQAVEDRAGRERPRRTRSRRRIRRAGAVALVAAGVVAATTIGVGGDDSIRVRASDAAADPEAVARELQAEGIDARILVVPVEHFETPVWWHLWFAPGVQVDRLAWARLKAQVGVGVIGLPDEELDHGNGVQHRTELVLPRGLPGPVTLVVGRVARPGEPLGAMDNELAPDGAFWCLQLDRMPPEQAIRAVKGLGYDVVLVLDTPARSDELEGLPPSARLTAAWFRSPKLVDLRFATEHVDEYRSAEGTPNEGDPVPPWSPPCD
jgi:hypothetical protein